MDNDTRVAAGRYPMPLTPAYKDYIWGGDRLVREYGKATDMRPVAESWELSCHPDGLCVVAAGAYEGRTLAGVLQERPDWIGARYTGIDGRDGSASVFPIIIKLIDAKTNLSLQVHPDDMYARANENSLGKNEAWYVVDCEPDAKLILGFKKPVSAAELAARIADGTILDVVKTVPVKPGDCYCVPAGMLHAIGGGALVAEVQQNSNVTYRVFDYGRLGTDGKPRQLHAKKAADVINTALCAFNSAEAARPERHQGYTSARLADWRYFSLERLDVGGGCDGGDGGGNGGDADGNADGGGGAVLRCDAHFHALLALDAGLALEWGDVGTKNAFAVAKGACVYVPAGLGEYRLRGRGRALLTKIQ